MMARNRLADLVRLYEILDDLERKVGGKRLLATASTRMNWPQRGLYLFFEAGESRTESGAGLRVVRVGTHAILDGSRTKLWDRLRNHQGTVREAGGNHRGSIFRLLVGTALANQDKSLTCDTWGRGSTATRQIRQHEGTLEAAVSVCIGQMPFLWLNVNDEPSKASKRAYLERNSISLLSNFEKHPMIDEQSTGWLGSWSDRARVRASGLWNNNHVDEQYDPRFLVILDEFVRAM